MFEKPSIKAKVQFENTLWIGRVYGVASFDGDELNPRFLFVLFMGILEQVMHFYGLYQSWPKVSYICNSLAIYCLILQLLVRLGNKFIRHDDENLQSMLKTVITIYEREEQVPDHQKILNNNLRISGLLINAYLSLCFVIFCVPNATAWIVSWYTGELILFTPLYLPFTDPTTLFWYMINSSLLVFYTMLVYFCFMTGDAFVIFFVYQCVAMVEIYCMKLRKFGENLKEVKTDQKIIVHNLEPEPSTSRNVAQLMPQKPLDNEKEKDIAIVEQQLIDLINEFNTYNNYLQSIFIYMEVTTFVATSLNSVAIAMALVVMLNYSKAIGGVLVLILFLQVLNPCVHSTVISRQKKKMLDELYGFPYYELTKSKQKIFLQFIHLVQNTKELNVPIVGIINMELFTNATP
jgi:hypothetical protein